MTDFRVLHRHAADAPVVWGPDGRARDALLLEVAGVRALLPDGQPGDQVVVATRDRYAFTVALLAAWSRGLAVALPPSTQPEAVRAVRHRDGVLTVLHDVGDESRGIDVRGRSGGEPVSLETLAFDAGRHLATVYTSGSTGDAVACRKTAGQLLGEAEALVQAFDLAGAQVLPMVPPHHIYGLLFGVLVPLVAGGAFHRRSPLHAEAVGRGIADGADVLVAVPAHLRGLTAASRAEMGGPLRRVFSSAAPLPPRVAARLAERLGWTITEVFGSSETGGIGWRTTGGSGPWKPFDGVRVEAGPGDQLRLWSPLLDPALPAPFVGGDRVQVQPDGTFVHLGRGDGVVKVGGVRVSLAEIDRRLGALDGVEDVAALAVDVEGARGTAVWVAAVAPGLRPADLKAALRGWLPRVALPRRIRLVDRLPRDERGKLPRAALRALFESRGDA